MKPVPKLILIAILLLHIHNAQAQSQNKTKRENINGTDVVPLLHFPGISQTAFHDAFNVLDECLVMDEPRFGFPYPFIAPGGHYGGCWWQLDGALALYGTKWVNQSFSENVLRGFMAVQKADGRIPLYGHQVVPGYPTGSSLPKYFLAARTVLRQSRDGALTDSVYKSLRRYLDWWLSAARRDERTGLITGVFEESFPPIENRLNTMAQVDLNVEVTTGCAYVAQLAGQLGYEKDHEKYLKHFKNLKKSINKYMWNDTQHAYFAYNVKDHLLDEKLIAYTFDPLKSNIAPANRTKMMLEMLMDNKYFNWEGNTVTSAAKTDKTYNETTGNYNGAPAWSGDIWTLRNEAIIRGLEDIGRYDLAAELSLKTVNLVNGNYTEFFNPADGKGHGVKRYAWTAAQYIQILIENIYGIDYDAFNKVISIRPNLHKSLEEKNLSLERLSLPDGGILNLYLLKKKNSTIVRYNIKGMDPEMRIVVTLPVNHSERCTGALLNGKPVKITMTKKHAAKHYQIDLGNMLSNEIIYILE